MSAKKYYAVRKGKTTGIFETWDECRRNVHGVSGATYKSFNTLAEAEDYMKLDSASRPRASHPSSEPLSSDISTEPESDFPIAYVDGSFSEKDGMYSYGCVIISPQGEITKKSGFGTNPEALANRNVAGELDGAIQAVIWAYENGYDRIHIRHDYEGISKWFTGEWKAKSYSSKAYLDCLSKYRDQIGITFEKVKAHSGDYYNEMADQLASAAIKEAMSSI